MKRRNFLKFLLAAPVVAKSLELEEIPALDNSESLDEVLSESASSSNCLMTPEEITREALNILNDNLIDQWSPDERSKFAARNVGALKFNTIKMGAS